MRFADILIDLAAVVKASKSVASKHLELRSRQLNQYGKTSIIVRSFKEQPRNEVQQRSKTATTRTETETNAPGQTESSEPIPEDAQKLAQALDPIHLRGNLGPSLVEQREKYENLSKSSRDNWTINAEKSASSSQRPTTPAIQEAAQKFKQQGNDSIHSYVGSSPRTTRAVPRSSEPAPEDDVPPGVNIDVFHTSRGNMLDAHKDYVGKRRPAAPVTTPSWFQDFGHDKNETKPVEDSKTQPPGSKVPQEKDASTSSLRTLTAEVEKHKVSGIDTPTSRQVEQEHTQVVKEILSQAGEQTSTDTSAMTSEETAKPAYVLRESKVPATRLSRLWNYGGLAAGMLGGAISEGFSRGFGGGGQGSVLLSSGNMERLVAKLSRMRGAALKLGQMMSFQDSKMLPAPIQEVLQRVQDRADYMPAWQREKVLTASLGPGWSELFGEFEEKPIAAASIGQVHRATLKSSGQRVAVKIQFPGVADSINSDLDNLSILLTASKMLPKGLYLNKTIDNARTELGWECDYEREAICGQRYRELLADERDIFVVPKIYPEASGKHVLTMEYMEGVGVTRVKSFNQEQRDWIGTQILRLCLREITEFRFMQTDPNWTNFMYNAMTNKLELLDFGASREYPEEFVSQYVSLLAAAARSDRQAVKDLSESLGYLTGHESKTMLDAHIASVLTLAEPFLQSAPEVYDFSDQTITERVKALIPVMIRERLAPPPEETYSLHRKLSGAFLLCAKLGSKVKCREMFLKALEKTDLEVKL